MKSHFLALFLLLDMTVFKMFFAGPSNYWGDVSFYYICSWTALQAIKCSFITFYPDIYAHFFKFCDLNKYNHWGVESKETFNYLIISLSLIVVGYYTEIKYLILFPFFSLAFVFRYYPDHKNSQRKINEIREL